MFEVRRGRPMQKYEAAGLRLEQARRRFEQWRRRNCYGRIPFDLWRCAAAVAAVHGLELTAARLRLDEDRLRQWMRRLENDAEDASSAQSSQFVELPSLDHGSTPECILELEEPSGRKLRISLKGAATRQALELGRMLWRSPP
jgi:hypothetical protein